MKLNRKKIIAKEFLILLGCGLIFCFALLGFYTYNFIIKSNINHIEKSKSSLANEIKTIEKAVFPKLSQQKWLYAKWVENNDFHPYESYTKMWERLEYLHKSDSIAYKWDNVWDEKLINFTKNLGFKTSKEFNNSISHNSLNSGDLKILEKTDSIKTEINLIKSKIQEKENKIIEKQIDLALLFLIIVGIIVYPVRIIYYAVRWSVKTLKMKE